MRKLPAWLRSHPILATIATVALLFTAMHFFLNWQSERRWQAYVRASRARGVKLYLTEFAPPKIPDEENFAALPMMRAIMKPGAKSPLALPDTPSGRPFSQNGERYDWVKWQAYFKDAGFISETTDSPPRDVLRALEHYAPQFQEWSQWRTRPRCRFNLDLNAGAAMPLTHLSSFQSAASLFALRMRAHLALGDSPAASGDFEEGFQAYHALVEEPTLISGLVRVSVLAILLNGIGDGLADHAWQDAELLKIDAVLATVRVWEDYRLSLRSERGFANWMYETLVGASGQNRARFFGGGGFSSPPATTSLFAIIPDRVFRDNQLRANQYFDETLAAISDDGTRFNPDQPTPSGPQNVKGFDRYYLFLFAISAPVYETVSVRFARTQARLDQARTGIAIERFRIARGALPKKLTDLVPDFMAAVPDDVYSGQPIVYRRKKDGGFSLYSVGPDRRDDGGATDPGKSEAKQPDWVWLN